MFHVEQEERACSLMQKAMKKCKKCGSEKLRAMEQSSCRVEVDNDGRISETWDSIPDGVDPASVYCEDCGENVDIYA